MNLRGVTAVVTGAAVRVGREIAERLGKEGVNVAVHYHSHDDAAARVVAEIESQGARAVAIKADLESPHAAAETIISQASKELGPIRILINCAAIFEPGSLADLTSEQWRRHLAVNLEAPAFLCREFAKQLPPGERGHVINIADWRGLRPQPGHLAYTVSKSGLICLTQILAQELGPRIQVNAVAPGAILPPPGATAETFELLAANNPLRRAGAPGDVADAVLFLLKSDFISGEVLHVTGGQELVAGRPARE